MKYLATFLTLFFVVEITSAQDLTNSAQLCLGKTFHGTGDLAGIAVDVFYERGLSKRISWSNGLITTIHFGKDNGLNGLVPGASPDKYLLRYTTAGIQFNSLANFALLAQPNHKVRLSAGPIVRLQSSSYPRSLGYHQDPSVFPVPFYVIYDYGQANTISLGYSIGASYLIRLATNYQIGVKATFQNDTNADAITQISLVFGRLFAEQ